MARGAKKQKLTSLSEVFGILQEKSHADHLPVADAL